MLEQLGNFLNRFAIEQLHSRNQEQAPVWIGSRSDRHLRAYLGLQDDKQGHSRTNGTPKGEIGAKPAATLGKLKARRQGKRDKTPSKALVHLRDHYQLPADPEQAATPIHPMRRLEGSPAAKESVRSTSNAEAASQDPASMTEGRHISEHLDVQVLDGQLQANVMVLGWDEIESSTQLGGSTELQETDSKLHLQPSVPLYATVFPSHALERHDELQQPVESMDPFGGTGDDPFVGQATLPILTTTAVENPAEKDDEWEEFQAPEHDEGLAASGLDVQGSADDWYATLPDLSFMIAEEIQ